MQAGETRQENGNSASLSATEHCSEESEEDKLQEKMPIFRKEILSA